jgi:hypothetical protein
MTDIYSDKLNYPWFLYPKFPVSGYFDIFSYKIELVKLYNELNNLIEKIKSPILFHLTIGAAMEEYIIENDSNYTFQWRQLFPVHLEKFATENPDIQIIHLIISPNESFSDKKYFTPKFVSNSKKIKFIETNKREFISSTHNIITKIFYTMMPTIQNNSYIIENLKEKFKSTDLIIDFDNYKQIKYDSDFTINFYKTLNILFNKIKSYGGIISIFSFAVFNCDTNLASIKNFIMFKELLDIISKDDPSIILAEWIFRFGFYCIIPYSKITNKYMIVYISQDDFTFDIEGVYQIYIKKYDKGFFIEYRDCLI